MGTMMARDRCHSLLSDVVGSGTVGLGHKMCWKFLTASFAQEPGAVTAATFQILEMSWVIFFFKRFTFNVLCIPPHIFKPTYNLGNI